MTASVGRPSGPQVPAGSVRIFDTTLRDGEQAPGAGLTAAEKLDVQVEAIHSRLDRVRGKLRESLSKHFTTLAVRRLEEPGVSIDAIRALRPLFRDPVILRHLEDLTETEAARRLEVPVTTLRARLRSAYELLGHEDPPDFSAARAAHRKEIRR